MALFFISLQHRDLENLQAFRQRMISHCPAAFFSPLRLAG